MNLLVLGNCQARPVAQILSRVPGIGILDPIILHLSHADQVNEHHAQMASADLILAQFTNCAFKPEHLAAGTVARNWPNKTLIWPNLFYSGQQPFLRYLTCPNQGRLMGPFDAVHDIRLLLEWHALRQGRSAPKIDTPEYIARVRAESIATLRNREASCDVGICDLIETHQDERRLFFTFNHPARWLLEALCARVTAHAQIDLPDAQDAREPLDRFIVPSTWTDRREPTFEGTQVTLQPDGTIISKGQQSYTPASLRETAFRCFDHLAPHLDLSALRLTPKLNADSAPLVSGLH
ncbi:WcbI family polysaccharide biosynthesis putative acetyltransferase [Roseovarius sp. S4756]|uniref:WcbI family polysaccharide biosynthesis putative acetyltransferase n=1 Tax=Roseovarius maritimus TaxID=3342637 RepID=UPI0037262FF9